MKIPRLVWNRRHNVAALSVSYGRRVWQTREVGDLILGYNAAARLSRVVLLDPRRMLPPQATAAEAIAIVIEALLRAGAIRQEELDVLKSALDRATLEEASSNGPTHGRIRPRGPFPLAPETGSRSVEAAP